MNGGLGKQKEDILDEPRFITSAIEMHDRKLSPANKAGSDASWRSIDEGNKQPESYHVV